MALVSNALFEQIIVAKTDSWRGQTDDLLQSHHLVFCNAALFQIGVPVAPVGRSIRHVESLVAHQTEPSSIRKHSEVIERTFLLSKTEPVSLRQPLSTAMAAKS